MPRRQPERRKRQRFTGGLYRKTGHYPDPETGEKRPYTYWQASREVAPEHLPPGVERKRITGSGRSEREAMARLEANWLAYHSEEGQQRARRRGRPRLSLEQLYELWQADNELGAVSDVMAYKYAGYFKNHIIPHLGSRKLDTITERDLRLLFLDTLPRKRRPRDGGQLLSVAATRNIYMALSGCLNYGGPNGHLDRAPLKAVAVPTPPPPRDDIATASANARTLLARLSEEGSPDYCRWLFQFLGLRRAERLGLAWGNIRDLHTDTPTLVVNQQLARYADGSGWYVKPYTKNSSPRSVFIPEPFITALREHQQAQQRHKASSEWNPEPRFADFVFLQSNGAIYTLNRDNREWRLLLERLGLPYWRAHLNRHITATWLAEQHPPIPMGTVQSILGHDSEAMAHYYAKSTKDQQAEPMRRYGQAIQGISSKPQRRRKPPA